MGEEPGEAHARACDEERRRRRARRRAAAKHVRELETRTWIASTGKKKSSDISEEERAMFVQCFHMLDSDSSGQISVDELQDAIEAIGVDNPRSEALKLLRKSDVDRSGEISLDEYLHMLSDTHGKKVDICDEPVLPLVLVSTIHKRHHLMRTVLLNDERANRAKSELYRQTVDGGPSTSVAEPVVATQRKTKGPKPRRPNRSGLAQRHAHIPAGDRDPLPSLGREAKRSGPPPRVFRIPPPPPSVLASNEAIGRRVKTISQSVSLPGIRSRARTSQRSAVV